MPAVNGKALELTIALALDMLELKVGDTHTITLRDTKMTWKRIE